jgi:DNA/RNA endonuclease G (NUC1)
MAFSSLFRSFVLLGLVVLAGSIHAQPPVVNPVEPAPALSPGESEPESPSAILRSGVRGSTLRKARLQSEFSAVEKTWIADNCVFGMPAPVEGAGLGVLRIVVREGYALGHSSESKIPYWVCEHSVKGELEGPGNRDKSSFKPEPKLSGQPRAELADYKGSGYDRGHMHPAANAKKTQVMMDETHFLSNIIPQVGPTFNQGIWAHLEDTVRQWTLARGETWIISGPMFYDPLEEDETTADGLVPFFTIGDGDVAVPTHCYKIVLAKNAAGEWESIAFVFKNERHGRPYRLSLHRTTIDWIEERTGLDFLPELSNDPATLPLVNRLEGQKSEMWETQ